MKTRLQSSIKELLAQAKKADGILDEIKQKAAKFDKETAKAGLNQLKSAGLAEAKKVREKLQKEVVQLTDELTKSSSKLKTESEKVRGKVQDTLKTVKAQIKAITEAERSKRRGRRGSE